MYSSTENQESSLRGNRISTFYLEVALQQKDLTNYFKKSGELLKLQVVSTYLQTVLILIIEQAQYSKPVESLAWQFHHEKLLQYSFVSAY